MLSTIVDQNKLGTEFSIVICRQTGAKWQLKTLFLAIFNTRSSIVKSVFDCRISVFTGLYPILNVLLVCVADANLLAHPEDMSPFNVI